EGVQIGGEIHRLFTFAPAIDTGTARGSDRQEPSRAPEDARSGPWILYALVGTRKKQGVPRIDVANRSPRVERASHRRVADPGAGTYIPGTDSMEKAESAHGGAIGMGSIEENGRRFFTTSEVARYCAVTNDGVLKWIKSGKLRAFSTPGGQYRVSSDDFREFLQKYDIPIDESFFSGASKSRSVLVVDDEPDIREIVRRVLKEMEPNLRIEEASD